MCSKIIARLLVAVFLQASAASAGGFLWDPVTTYNNGMPLASSQPHRDADFYHGCNRYHIGACGGKYTTQLGQSLFHPKSVRDTYRERQPMLDSTTPGVLVSPYASQVLFDGVETARAERLGPAPNVAVGVQGGP